MKIMHIVTRASIGGAQSVVASLSNGMQKEHSVVVVSNNEEGLWSQILESIKVYKVNSLKREVSIANDFISIIKIRSIIKKESPNVVTLHSSKAGLLGRIACIGLTIKTVYVVHGFDSIRIAHRKFLVLEKILAWRTDRIIAVSKYDLDNLHHEGIKRRTIQINNGVVASRVNSLLDIDRSIVNVVQVSRLDKPKRYDLYEKIADYFSSDKIRFYWIGNEENISHPSITFLGCLPEASQYLNNFDLVCLLSDYEGLPMAIIEAMAARKAIIASNVGGIHELISKETGLLVNNDFYEICEALNNIIFDKSQLKKLGENGYEKYLSKYSDTEMVNKYLNEYNKIL